MAHGVPTDEATLAEFRALYLYSGNASKVGRELDIPDRTARKIAERLEEDPSFAEDGRKMRTRALDRLVMMRMSIAEAAQERYLNDLPVPQVSGTGAVTVIDKRADDGKLVLEAEKNAQHLAKFEADREAGKGAGAANVEVHVHLKTEPVESKPDGESDPEPQGGG